VRSVLTGGKFLRLAALDAAFFFASGWTRQSAEHSGTLSNVLWVDFLLGVLLLIALAAAIAVRGILSLRR
jgi:hypothetical protein